MTPPASKPVMPRILSVPLSILDRLIATLQAPERREPALALCLVGYALVWAAYGTVSLSLTELPTDMAEGVVAGRDVGFGYYKHPPLSLWVPTAWFAVLPFSRFLYFLLSMSGAALALWAAWRLSARWLDAQKRLAGVALLSLVPFLNFHALNFNANAVLIPTWALATWWFWNSLATRSSLWAVLAGAATAAALLGKYWSGFLVVALLAAAMLSPHRRAYFRSAAPWLSTATALLLLAPHLWWLSANFSVKSIISVAAYAAAPVLLLYFAVPGNAATRVRVLGEAFRPAEMERRAILAAFLTPILLPALFGLVMKIKISSVWAMPSFTLLPVVLLPAHSVALTRSGLRTIVAAALIFPVLALMASPMVAAILERQRPMPNYESVAHAGLAFWQRTTSAPLRMVAGEATLDVGLYLGANVSAFPLFWQRWAPWATEERIRREGMLVVCLPGQAWCSIGAAEWGGRAGGLAREEVTVKSRSGSRDFPFVLFVVRPAP
jgi:4-amino-4-deoxy-L-arabinose transferase-like glycosyltransferase